MRRFSYIFFLFILTTAPQPAVAARGLGRELARKAELVLVQGRIAQAVTLLRGALILADDAEVLRQLASLNTMTGQFEEAVENYQALLKRKLTPDTAQFARAEIARLKSAPIPFIEEIPTRVPATNEARQTFRLGLQLVRRKKLAEALPYLRASLELDPALPGSYRVLGALYGALKDPDKERAFLQDYLRIRPDGKIADTIRQRLRPTGLLASLQVAASFPCKVWVSGRSLNKTTPLEVLLLPAGAHTVSLVNEEFHLIRNFRVHLRAGGKKELRFDFGVLALKLDPWARARVNGKDLGLWDRIGLPVGTYELSLTAHDGSRKKQDRMTVRAAQVLTISRW